MTTPHSPEHFTGCTCGGDRPCRVHPEKPSDGNNLWSAEELRSTEVENLAHYLARLVKQAKGGEHLLLTWKADAEEALEKAKRLGIHA